MPDDEESKEERRKRLQREFDMDHSWDVSQQRSADQRAEEEAEAEEEEELAYFELLRDKQRQAALDRFDLTESEKRTFAAEFDVPVEALVLGQGVEFALISWRDEQRGDIVFHVSPSKAIRKWIDDVLWDRLGEFEKYMPPSVESQPAQPSLREEFLAYLRTLNKTEFQAGELTDHLMAFGEMANRETARKNITRWVKEPPFEKIARGKYRIKPE